MIDRSASAVEDNGAASLARELENAILRKRRDAQDRFLERVNDTRSVLADPGGVESRFVVHQVMPLDDGIRLENDLATLLRTTEDRVEGAKAFVEKRKPRWTGR